MMIVYHLKLSFYLVVIIKNANTYSPNKGRPNYISNIDSKLISFKNS